MFKILNDFLEVYLKNNKSFFHIFLGDLNIKILKAKNTR